MRILATILAFLLFIPPVWADPLTDKASKAVGLLYTQNSAGSMQMRCTTTAFHKTEKGYLFATAAHCVGDDQVAKERSAKHDDLNWYVTFDEVSKVSKHFHPAKVKWVGYQSRGEDIAVFEVATTETWETIELGNEKDLKDGAEIVNLAAPLGLGVQTFHGTISKVFLDRPVTEGTINWKGTMMLQLPGTQGGSSGSAIISIEQKAIVGFLVGTIGNGTIIAIPVSRFKAVAKAVADGKYKYYSDTVETNPDGTPVE